MPQDGVHPTDAPAPPDGAAELSPAAGEALVAWYDAHARTLPWRVKGGRADPYRVWLSEVMLQQTTVAAVIPYFERFSMRWPTVEALAAAPDEDVLAAWAGLGYYARARNLIACARTVAAAGAFPDTAEGLRTLPGVGAYTSAAIAAIAFDEPVPVVDGNVERVVARLIMLERAPKSALGTIRSAVAGMLPATRPGDFAQAMMDLGATICTPKRPACGLCPLRQWCKAARFAEPMDYPRRPPRRSRQAWYGTAFVPIRRDGAVLVRQRPPEGLLGGMTEVFGSPWANEPAATLDLSYAPFEADWALAGSVEHGFTHAELFLQVFGADVAMDAPTPAGGFWRAPEEAGLPSLMRKVVVRALAARPNPPPTPDPLAT